MQLGLGHAKNVVFFPPPLLEKLVLASFDSKKKGRREKDTKLTITTAETLARKNSPIDESRGKLLSVVL